MGEKKKKENQTTADHAICRNSALKERKDSTHGVSTVRKIVS